MRSNELMIGDWVRSSFYHTPVQIQAIKLSSYEYGWISCTVDRRAPYREDFKSDGSLSPIPLTAEILEKNGFVASESCLQNYQSFIQYYRDGICIVLESKWGNAFTIMCDHLEGDCPRYVHQLQNLFRVYGDDGLNDLADNFKID